MFSISRTLLPVVVLATCVSRTLGQTFTECNPLVNPGTCPPNPALGTSTAVSFNSASDAFGEAGVVTYGSNGAQFTVAQKGDNPHISSKWYIMFGHVEFEIKAAPGQGVVSSAVLMSDCLDEIDWEWLGGDDNQVQSNYFRKGQTVTGYNRGAFHSAPGNHDSFHKYAIDWTADQIVWSIDGSTVRVLEAGDAQNGDYPQTPMQIKVGAWAGGDPGNPQGTIDWAGGLTDYSQGPFSMYLKSIAVTDYSTGSSYSYVGTTGTWESITADGGSVNPQGNGQPASTGDAPAITSTVPNDSSAPLAFDPHDSASVYATRTGWPWEGTATVSVVPTGWSIDRNGNAHPPSSGAAPFPSSYSPQASYSASYSGSGLEISTEATVLPSESSPSAAGQTVSRSPPSAAITTTQPPQTESSASVGSTSSASGASARADTTHQSSSGPVSSASTTNLSTLATSTSAEITTSETTPSSPSVTTTSQAPDATPQAPSAGAASNLPWACVWFCILPILIFLT